MKKILILTIFLGLLPVVSSAQFTETCTGDIAYDMADAEACAALAESQGTSLGYDISCDVSIHTFPFIDPTTGLSFYLSRTCTVNGTPGFGAELLAGFEWVRPADYQFPLDPLIKHINPGWDTLKTELEFLASQGATGAGATSGNVGTTISNQSNIQTGGTGSVKPGANHQQPATQSAPGSSGTNSVSGYVNSVMQLLTSMIANLKAQVANVNNGGSQNYAKQNTSGDAGQVQNTQINQLQVTNAVIKGSGGSAGEAVYVGPSTGGNTQSTTDNKFTQRCTGDIAYDMADAQTCANLAESQGRSLGYDISCKVNINTFPFIDPTTGLSFYLSRTCTVNGTPGFSAELLAGFEWVRPADYQFPVEPILKHINPGWDRLKTELEFLNSQ